MAKRVAVVTGANKGIGFAIVRGLCKQFEGDVYLTGYGKSISRLALDYIYVSPSTNGDIVFQCRNEELGRKAVSDLKAEGLDPKFHQLDLTNKDSITTLQTFLKSNYGGLDILVNNAGIAYKDVSTDPFSERAAETVKTNFTGTLDMCEALFTILNPHARVVNVSSMFSIWSLGKCNEEMKMKFTDPKLDMETLKGLVAKFVSAAQTGEHQAQGFSNSAYGMSKIGVTCMSFIQQRQLNKDSRPDIVVNACCPGYVNTDMSSHKGHKTIDQGAETPLYLAMLPANITSPKGNFVYDRKVVAWK